MSSYNSVIDLVQNSSLFTQNHVSAKDPKKLGKALECACQVSPQMTNNQSSHRIADVKVNETAGKGLPLSSNTHQCIIVIALQAENYSHITEVKQLTVTTC